MTLLWWHWLLIGIFLASIYLAIMAHLYIWTDTNSKMDSALIVIFSFLWPLLWPALVIFVRHDSKEERERKKLLEKGRL